MNNVALFFSFKETLLHLLITVKNKLTTNRYFYEPKEQ